MTKVWTTWGRQAAVAAAVGIAAGLAACSASKPMHADARPGALRQSANAATIGAELAGMPDDAFDFLQHDVTLSDPFFEGRSADTRGGELAAEYLEWYFRQMGLQIGFTQQTVQFDATEDPDDGPDFVQPFTVRGATEVTAALASFHGANGTRELADGKDFVALGHAGEISDATPLPIVFVGYGLEDEDRNYTSFDGAEDLHGKIAMVLRFEPMDEKGHSKWAKTGWTEAAGLYGKFKALTDLGASGVILVNPPGADDPRIDGLARPGGMGIGEINGPAIMVSEARADAIVRAADPGGRSLRQLREVADAGSHAPIMLDRGGAAFSMTVGLDRMRYETGNVAAILPGSGDLANEYVVLGAHYDHLGYGHFGSRGGLKAEGVIHPGADDNASGTAAVLVLAKRFKALYDQMGDEPRRSILFFCFAAEERGLLGSNFFIQHTPLTNEQVAAMINFDMVGRVKDDDVEVSGFGTSDSWNQLLDAAVAQSPSASGLKFERLKATGGRSDHANFSRVGIPVLHFFSGMHGDYHMPSDTADKINVVGAMRIMEVVEHLMLDLATRADQPEYTGKQPGAGGAPAEQEDRPRSRMKVRFGIAPGSYEEEKGGVMVGEVYPGTPAALGGLQSGDLMVTWNGEEIIDVQTWFQALVNHEPGDVVNVGVVRNGERKELQVTLTARDDAQ
ncbi:MAG: M28 family peptidase [Phycisphaerales bacterium]|nr:M28 family peptidase [Phycisphaerales bacterium]